MFLSKKINPTQAGIMLNDTRGLISIGCDSSKEQIRLACADLDWVSQGFSPNVFLGAEKSYFSVGIQDFIDGSLNGADSAKFSACVYSDSWHRGDFFSRGLSNSLVSGSVLRPLGFDRGLRNLSENKNVDFSLLLQAALGSYIHCCESSHIIFNLNIANDYLATYLRNIYGNFPFLFLVCDPALMVSHWLNSDLNERHLMVDRFARESGIDTKEERQTITPINAFFGVVKNYYKKVKNLSEILNDCYIFETTYPTESSFHALCNSLSLKDVDIQSAKIHMISDKAQKAAVVEQIKLYESYVPAAIRDEFESLKSSRFSCGYCE